MITKILLMLLIIAPMGALLWFLLDRQIKNYEKGIKELDLFRKGDMPEARQDRPDKDKKNG